MTQALSDSALCERCGHTMGRHEELSGAGPGTKAKLLCLVGGCRKCGFTMPKKRKVKKAEVETK